VNVVGELKTKSNSYGIARFPCDSTAFLYYLLLPTPKKEGCVLGNLCLFFCLFVCPLFWMNFCWVGRGQRNNQLRFGTIQIMIPIQEYLDLYPDPGIFKGFFIYCCNSYRQLIIKHDSRQRRFDLSDCFLVLL